VEKIVYPARILFIYLFFSFTFNLVGMPSLKFEKIKCVAYGNQIYPYKEKATKETYM